MDIRSGRRAPPSFGLATYARATNMQAPRYDGRIVSVDPYRIARHGAVIALLSNATMVWASARPCSEALVWKVMPVLDRMTPSRCAVA